MSERVTISIENQVATVTLNRPEKRNALDRAMFTGIVEAGEALAARKDVRAVVLTGAGEAFCAGIDVTSFPDLMKLNTEGGGIMARSHGDANIFQRVSLVWRDLPQPVIAALHGYAFGGGFQIMFGADIRIAAPDCRFSIMESRWGLVPDMGGMVLFPSVLRQDLLRRLTYTGEVFEGLQAEAWGVVTEVSADPLARAQALAAEIAGKSPDAMRAAKRLITLTEKASREQALLLESEIQGEILGQPNQMEALMAGMQKRAPVFKD
ncbi:putative enoyl-CoA hydratase echA8 [Pseudoruegeria aquimaris]|uniref:Putative enoyl-CoA hydratase echA8 n=1 Tax=Pseudoruegeria aquimaris TaxID=393663 RepID=A0A1Y5TEM2_9RHOB|nr:crotonase/enoyl-CoA hydratase family protein [Pseudoruegeria aquimaris]SLN62388.1 putative enoyl-CoA hydratase echA8 [Pseudoruegeria aquimaris]